MTLYWLANARGALNLVTPHCDAKIKPTIATGIRVSSVVQAETPITKRTARLPQYASLLKPHSSPLPEHAQGLAWQRHGPDILNRLIQLEPYNIQVHEHLRHDFLSPLPQGLCSMSPPAYFKELSKELSLSLRHSLRLMSPSSRTVPLVV
ncbi:hypothetical protein ACLOJK_022522 [Asimina triloba]